MHVPVQSGNSKWSDLHARPQDRRTQTLPADGYGDRTRRLERRKRAGALHYSCKCRPGAGPSNSFQKGVPSLTLLHPNRPPTSEVPLPGTVKTVFFVLGPRLLSTVGVRCPCSLVLGASSENESTDTACSFFEHTPPVPVPGGRRPLAGSSIEGGKTKRVKEGTVPGLAG